MKKQKPFIIRWIIRVVCYQLVLLVIFYLSTGINVLEESVREGRGFQGMALYFEMSLPMIMLFMVYCFLFLVPCVFGALTCMLLERKWPKRELLWGVSIHSLIYIIGLLIVVKVTRLPIEFYAYDAIAYGFILLATVIYWAARGSRKWRSG